MDFLALKKNLKKDASSLPTFRLAILGDSATQFLCDAIRGTAFEFGLNIQIFEAEYNTIGASLLNVASDLYAFQPQALLVFESLKQFAREYSTTPLERRSQFAQTRLQRVEGWHLFLQQHAPCPFLYANLPTSLDSTFGNFGTKIVESLNFQRREFNYELSRLAQREPNLHVIDLEAVLGSIGTSNACDPILSSNADMVLSFDALPLVARQIVACVQSLRGLAKKCLILDLDNLIWGGVIGDDGVENIELGELGRGNIFLDVQRWALELQQRGILICVASKNEEEVAKAAFLQHPDMILRLEHIAVFKASWNPKVDAIRDIQKVLNIGFDSMVFLDDTPVERSFVREYLPEVSVPELPEDPACYLSFLESLALFETTSHSSNDSQRTQQYQEEANRLKERSTFTNADDFLKSLNMEAEVSGFDDFNIPRIAQLSQRSNQFNLRTIRYTDEDIRRIALSPNHVGFAVSLADTFGDYGLISVVIVEKQGENWFLDTWIMSCRVLQRGVEHFVLETLLKTAAASGIVALVGEYLPTKKNIVVRDHYRNLGFVEENDRWVFKVANKNTLRHFVRDKENG